MRISELATLLGGTVLSGHDRELTVTSITADSRAVQPDSIFVAVTGGSVDGHRFISDAVEKGAVLLVVSEPQEGLSVPVILVKDTRQALSQLSSWFYGEPSRQMTCIGVTGTNGKTTINWILYNLMNQRSLPAVRIGTLGVRAEGVLDLPGELTTPDVLTIQRSLATALEAGCKGAVLETSSHALDQHRVHSINFEVGVFTNLTRDHLDYHQTMERYYRAKELLVDLLAASTRERRAMVVNLDDSYGDRMAARAKALGIRVVGFGKKRSGTNEKPSIEIESFEQSIAGSALKLAVEGKPLLIRSRYIGFHNAENIAAVIGVAHALQWSLEEVAASFLGLPMVPGRLEPVGSSRLGIYVDYAHSPDALEKVLAALRPLTRGKLWVVFGCGGDRDRGKRPQMAAVAARLADRVMVTSDNPRTEEPEGIINEILGGGAAAPSVPAPWGTEVDRRKAIQRVIRAADDGDVILIAGKGHEDYQIIGKTKHHFSDQSEACAALAERERGGQNIV
jgi:UDP-N-acetylmuramyl-tripeptide synthetase